MDGVQLCVTPDGRGWEIDHIRPVSANGGDYLDMPQPFQWENNRSKRTLSQVDPAKRGRYSLLSLDRAAANSLPDLFSKNSEIVTKGVTVIVNHSCFRKQLLSTKRDQDV